MSPGRPDNDHPDFEERIVEAVHMASLIGAVWQAKVAAADAFRPMLPAFEPIVFADVGERQAFGFAIKDLHRRLRELGCGGASSSPQVPDAKPRQK